MNPLDPSAPVRSIRELASLTQAELARRLGTSPAYVSKIERMGPRVRWPLIGRVADACGVEVELRGRRLP